ncbi:MAG: 30S ribosomal protein S18 [Chloroflexota bacterium]
MATTRNSDARGLRPRRDKPRYIPRRRVCAFCADKSKVIDFRDAGKLRRYLSDRGRIDSRRKTATCAKHQRELATALKRARHLAMLPFTLSHIRLSGTVGLRPQFSRAPLAPPQERPAQQAPAVPAAAAQASVTQAPAPEAAVEEATAEPSPAPPQV